MEKIWFIYDKQAVTGPYSTQDLHQKVSSGEIMARSKVWWKGQRDWIDLESWIENHLDYEKSIGNGEEAVWYALKDGHHIGPNTKSQLIELLSSMNNLSKIRVWKRGQEKWATIYQFNDLSDELGITKRKFVRAPIIGEVIINTNGNQSSFTAATISQGGIGFTGKSTLKEGDDVKLTIRSPLLVNAISATAKIKHMSEKHTGMEFMSIDEELVNMIKDYVDQFAGPSSQYVRTA